MNIAEDVSVFKKGFFIKFHIISKGGKELFDFWNGYLPNRQLRKYVHRRTFFMTSYLPNRQLRNSPIFGDFLFANVFVRQKETINNRLIEKRTCCKRI